jgi:hypothetical protein
MDQRRGPGKFPFVPEAGKVKGELISGESAGRLRSVQRSKVDGFDRRPSGEALQQCSFAQRRFPLGLRGVLKFAPGATKDFVLAAARALDHVTIEIRRGEVFGLAGTD